ncbi:MAG TPA: hypothetical protein VGQ58_02315 [Candidatus Limnocylindrales bacterium]|jgi:hypothetical protein|nr:hypothetical protein [Candidatus Limnocylindrales bacterium]
MAVRLQLKLGAVAEQDRLQDSPDTIVVVEPSVGSVARSKGHLYLLVTSRNPGNRGRDATRLAAETIRNEYYYDESAGIRVCLEKAIGAANKRLAHQRDRLGLGGVDGNGPIGIGVAVVRGNELYVATCGPAEAYLIRQARLSTLPDPHRERGLPAPDLEPDVWRGEVSVGDSLVLISPNVMARLGPDELKDAMVTLHPQSAMEHLHHRFAAADGSGSDGAIAFEATEVAVTQKHRALVPVKPPEPLAGAPDRSPIPLADPVVDGVAAVQAGARQARAAAGNAFERLVHRLQDSLPRRRAAYRRVTPLSARRETQRRAAVAILAFIVVAVGLGMVVYLSGAGPASRDAVSSIAAGQRAIEAARANLSRVTGPGIDLVRDNRELALQLLNEAWSELDKAEQANMPASVVRPIRSAIVDQLDRAYKVVEVNDEALFAFDPAASPPIDLTALVRGPDDAPYILDRTTSAVWRINLQTAQATRVIREGTEAADAVAAAPKLLAAGGPDLLVLDARNVLWRWRPSDDAGHGQLARTRINGSAEWGDDVIAIGTYIRLPEAGLYNFYVIDPSEKQILGYSPAADGSGFLGTPTGRLATARSVDRMTSLYIDGDIFVTEDGKIVRFVSGNSEGWTANEPGDTLLREAPSYTLVTSGSDRRQGLLYGYDQENARIVAIDKADGSFREQYRLPADNEGWTELRSMYVIDGADDLPPVLFWISADVLHRSVLAPLPDGAASPSPGASGPAGSGGPSGPGQPSASPATQ